MSSPLLYPVASLLLGLMAALMLPACRPDPGPAGEVIVYAAQDQIFAEPLLGEFTRETGIRARVVYDSEAVKTVGLANRLLAERNRPQADLFWGNEELRTRQLAAAEVWRTNDGWVAFGQRRRVWLTHSNAVPANPPQSLLELTNPAWRGRVVMARPWFGSTATHFLVLRGHWGTNGWTAWCRALVANEARFVEGNSHVIKAVVRSPGTLGLTDSDDVAVALREGQPVRELPDPREGLRLPNTLGIVRGGPNPAAAEWLRAWLQQPAVMARLAAAGALDAPGAGAPGLTVAWDRLLPDIPAGTEAMRVIFLR